MNFLKLSADVSGIGGAESATLSIAYGGTPDSLSFTNDAATVTGPGAVAATLTRLQPGCLYYVKAILSTDENPPQAAESPVAAFQTAISDNFPGFTLLEYIGASGGQYINTGLFPDHTLDVEMDFQTDNTSSDKMLFGVRNAGFAFICWIGKTRGERFAPNYGNSNGNIASDLPTGATAGERILFRFGSGGMGAKGSEYYSAAQLASYTNAPASTQPLILMGLSNNGSIDSRKFVGNCYGFRAWQGGEAVLDLVPARRDSDSAIGMLDTIHGTFLANAAATPFAAGPVTSFHATENIEGGVLESVSLTFDESESQRELRVAIGPVHGGDDPSDWARTEAVATIGAGETAASWTPPATWGGDDDLVARFYFAGDPVVWSGSVFHRDYAGVSLGGAVSLDGVGGDTITVSGSVASFGGDSCELVVYTGYGPDAITNEWSNLQGSTLYEPGEFSLALHEADTSSPRYIAPGSAVYVTVKAMSGGNAASSVPVSVTTKAAPAFSANPTASVSSRKVTFPGSLADTGAGGSAVVSLYVGPQSSTEAALELAGSSRVSAAGGSFSFTYTFDDFETTYRWQVRAVATTAGGIRLETRSPLSTCTTQDGATYNWQPVDGDWNGDWSDPRHWSPSTQDCIGFPRSAGATASFANCTLANPVVVNVDGQYTLNYLRWQGAEASDVTFAGSGAGSSAISCNTYNYNSGNRVRSNSRVEFRDMTLTRRGDWEILRNNVGSTNVTMRFSGTRTTGDNYFSLAAPDCRFEFVDGSYAEAFKINVGGTNTVFLLDDSTVNAKSSGFFINADVSAANAGPVDVIIRGRDAKFTANAFYVYSHNTYPMNVRLEVPVGGFAEAPIQVSGAIGGSTSGKIVLSVENTSPALTKTRDALTGMVVAQQTGSAEVNTGAVEFGSVPAHGGTPAGAFRYDKESGPRQILLDLQGWGAAPTFLYFR